MSDLVFETFIDQAMGDQKVLSPFPAEHSEEFGERSWRIRGVLFDVIYWDCGNGWAVVQQVIVHGPANEGRNVFDEFVPARWSHQEAYTQLSRFFAALAKRVGESPDLTNLEHIDA
jgi:hypothetical protein